MKFDPTPLKIGITGGIGSGKTYVCQLLEKMGFPVYYSDIASKKLTETNSSIRENLLHLLGESVYINGQLNKPFLAEKIFHDNAIRQQVNAIIHPVVRNDFNEWAQQQNTRYVFNEAAILIETGSYKTLDFVVLVTAEKSLRIQRAMKRDGSTQEQVEERISKQWEDEEKMKYADFVIYNDHRPLVCQIEKMLAQLAHSLMR